MSVTDRVNSAIFPWRRPQRPEGILARGGSISAAQGRLGNASAETPDVPRSAYHDAHIARTLAPIFVALVFWLHTFAPAGVAVPALFVLPILLFIRTGRFWEPLLVAVAATAATTAGPYLPHAGGSADIDRLNLPLELAIIWLSAGSVAYHRVASDRWSRQVARKQSALEETIQQRKAAEAKLAQQAALTQLGQLAAVVAHEVRNPLAGLRGTLEVLRPRMAASPRDRDVVQVMIERIDTLNAKVNDILRFARPQTPVLQPLNTSVIIAEAVESAFASFGRDRPDVAVTGDPTAVHADPEMLRAALLNLVLNACQAGSTHVEIRTSSDTDVCRIEVLDNGSGIPEDAIAHLFEAFYTTKKAGTGLGLPIVKRLLELQDGSINLQPRNGGGTVAEVTLLLASHAAVFSR
jgi:signal transduction histidine kinase